MGKIVVFNLISVDGFFARENGDIDWHNADDEFDKFGAEQTKSFGTIIFGRTTYEIFEDFWPKVVGNKKFSKDDREIAEIIENAKKIVFSKSLKKVTWNNAKLFNKIDNKEVKKLKQKTRSDIVIFGSGTIVNQFAELGLIDEYRLLVNPLILGSGKSMFTNKSQLNLKLTGTRVFKNGNVLLKYEPNK